MTDALLIVVNGYCYMYRYTSLKFLCVCMYVMGNLRRLLFLGEHECSILWDMSVGCRQYIINLESEHSELGSLEVSIEVRGFELRLKTVYDLARKKKCRSHGWGHRG